MTEQSVPPSAPPPPPPSGFFASVRRLGIWRSQDRWAGGVAAGIARRYGVDPLLVRGILVVVTMFGGLGLVLYGLGWALLPEASDGRIHLEQAVRGDFDIALAGAAAVLLVGLTRPVFWWTSSWWAVPWLLVLGALVAVVLISRDARTKGARPDPVHHPAPPHPAEPHPTEPHPTEPHPTEPPSAATTAAPYRPAYHLPEETMSHPAPPMGEAQPGAAPDVDAAGDQDAVGSHAGDTRRDDTATGDVTRPLPGEPAPPPSGAGPAWEASHSGPAWGGGGAGGPGDPGAAPRPDQPPPPPPQPPVPGPGSRATSLVLAVSMLAAAAIALAHHQDVLDANPWLVGGGAVIAILGAGVLISGLRGRTQGGLGGFALVLALILVPTAAAAAALPGFVRIGTSSTTWAGDPSWTPTTAEAAEDGYTLVAGELVADLTRLPQDADLTIPVGVTFGNLHLVIPDDADVTIEAGVGGGEVVGRLGEDWTGPNLPTSGRDSSLTTGMGVNTTLNRDGTGPQLTIEAEVGFGQIHIEEESS